MIMNKIKHIFVRAAPDTLHYIIHMYNIQHEISTSARVSPLMGSVPCKMAKGLCSVQIFSG